MSEAHIERLTEMLNRVLEAIRGINQNLDQVKERLAAVEHSQNLLDANQQLLQGAQSGLNQQMVLLQKRCVLRGRAIKSVLTAVDCVPKDGAL